MPRRTLLLLLAACGAPPTPQAVPAHGFEDVIVRDGRPPVAVVGREGDPSPALAVAVSTEGVLPARAPELSLAVATLLEERLRAEWPGLESRPAWDGFELRGLVTEERIEPLVMAVERAAKAPVQPNEVEAVRRRLAVLAKKPLPDPALREVARCRGDLFAVSPKAADVTANDLELWRGAALGVGRVALAVVGGARATERATAAARNMGAWSAATRATAPEAVAAPSPQAFVEAPGLVAPRGMRGYVVVRSADAVRAVAVGRELGRESSPLLARFAGLESAPRVEEIAATAGPSGGCIAIALDFGSVDLVAPATASRIATGVSLVAQEARQSLAEVVPPPSLGKSIARSAADPREAAERAAWWTLVGTTASSDAAAEPESRTVLVYGPNKDKPTPAGAAQAIEAAMDRAKRAFQTPLVATKARVEPGQAELWLLFASPCGTGAEVSADAGFSAAFAVAAAESRAGATNGVVLEPWITPDAVGLIAHAPALAGEAPALHARRVADAAARAFGADPLDERALARVRAGLRARANDPRVRALFAVGESIAPGHPSWLFAEGNPDALARVSVQNLVSRATALREGPLRVAILANVDEAQAAAAGRAVDRWIARRPEGVRACPLPNAGATPRPGMYAVEANGVYEAYLAFPVADAAREPATWLADALEAEGGLLSTTLTGAGLAKSATARVVGGRFGAALVVHVASSEGALDAAVAQVRVLFDRLRKGALTDADLTRAATRRESLEPRAALDPRARLAALFADVPKTRGATPPAATVNALLPNLLREEALTVVAMRPPRSRPQ